MIFTAVVVSIMLIYSEIVHEFMSKILLLVLCAIASIGILTIIIAVFLCGYGRRVPINYILLAIFTVCFAYIVAIFCLIVLVSYTNGRIHLKYILIVDIILMSVTMTAATTIGLTIVAFTTNSDFTTLHPILCLVMIITVIMMIFMIITSNPFYYILYCILGMFAYSGYIILDTIVIFGE